MAKPTGLRWESGGNVWSAVVGDDLVGWVERIGSGFYLTFTAGGSLLGTYGYLSEARGSLYIYLTKGKLL